MDYSKLVASHEENNADLTIAALQVSLEEATQFGVMQVDAENRIIGFEEKPAKPKPIPGNPNLAMASMGSSLECTPPKLREASQQASPSCPKSRRLSRSCPRMCASSPQKVI
jgi:glucose-1-phosphate adenylyltransferase